MRKRENIEYLNLKVMKKLTIIAIIGISISISLPACKKKAAQIEKTEKIEQIETVILQSEKIDRILNFSTVLDGYDQMNISPSLTGIIEKILVDVGSKVSQGQLLIRMDPTQCNTTKINLNAAKVELDRIEMLYQSGSASKQVYDQVKSTYDQLKEQVAFLEANTYVKAQFSGVISAKNLETGEMYNGARPILALTQVNKLKALVNIPEIYFPYVKTGMSIIINSEIYPNQTFRATIETIYPTIDPGTHTFQLKLKIPNDKMLLRPGMYVNTTLSLGQMEAIAAPYNAVLKLTGANNRYVFINDNGIARRVDVKLGQRIDDRIEISGEGIATGIELITAGQARLIDGVKVQTIKVN